MRIRSATLRSNQQACRASLGLSTLTLATAVLLSVALLASGLSSPAYGRSHSQEKPKDAEFKYAGGTENIPEGCGGRLELSQEALTFKCFQYTLAIPYSSISLMQYRPNVSKEVRKLKLKWKVRPTGGGGKHNRYFTIRYTQGGTTHVVVLDVLPDAMRPYLAEIDLKVGRRVEVKGYESYD